MQIFFNKFSIAWSVHRLTLRCSAVGTEELKIGRVDYKLYVDFHGRSAVDLQHGRVGPLNPWLSKSQLY